MRFPYLHASVPQGSPLSPSLFLVTCEPLHEYLRGDSRVRGLRLPGGQELKTSGFADDSALYVADSDSLKWVERALKLYCSASAASLNHEKTVGVMLAGADPWQQGHLRVDTWVRESECERYLGVYIGMLPSSRHDFLQSQARGGPWATGLPKRTPGTPQAMRGGDAVESTQPSSPGQARLGS